MRPGTAATSSAAKHMVLIAYGLAALFPLVLLVSTSLRSQALVNSDPFGLFSSFTWSNFSTAWTAGNFSTYLVNSVLLTVPSTLLVVVLSTTAGYAYARLRFPFRTLLFYVTIFGLLVPFFAYMIPLYYQMRSMGLLNTLVGTDLVLASTGLALGTFFMRAFFIDLPVELEQAARIDNCAEWQVFWYVMFPFVRSGAAALGVFTFIQNWNNFLVPLLFLPNGNYRPVTLGLYVWETARIDNNGPVAAASIMTVLPVIGLFIFTQRHLIRGFSAGAVKG